MIHLLRKDSYEFPDPLWYPKEFFEPDSLYAIGGDLSPKRLLNAYPLGIFPWTDKRKKRFEWYCPMDRFVILPDRVHISHSMRSLLKKDVFSVSFNQDFEGVISNCSSLRLNLDGAWLDERMVKAYSSLYRMGWAKSVEVWSGDRLVGGLYGIRIGAVFFGESMFSLVPNASKVALISLCEKMVSEGGALIDCQFHTPHLASMGGFFISYRLYRKILSQPSEASTIFCSIPF